MLNSITGGCVMPREILKWLDSLDLTFSVKNPRVDIANGFIIAQILTRYFPKQVNIYTYYNAQSKEKRHNNWQQVQKVLAKKQFKLTKQQYEGIANLGPDQGQNLLYRLYEFLTKKKLNLQKRKVQQEQLPLYSKPTASHLAKDRELNRIVDNNEKLYKTKSLINNHLTTIKSQKYNSGLIEWLISKRKMQIQEQVIKQQEELTRRTKSIANNETKGQVKQIQLKCFNSSTSKKTKGHQGDFTEAKGINDFLNDVCISILKKEPFLKDIKKLGLEIKEKDANQINILSEIFQRFDQKDAEGENKVQLSTLQILLNQLSQLSQVTLVIESINNNFIDFKKYFNLFLKPLRVLRAEDIAYKSIISLLLAVAQKLQQYQYDNIHLMFRSLVLPSLLEIGNRYPSKRYSICQICIAFTKKNTIHHYEIISKVKQHLNQNIKIYVSYLSHFINILIKIGGQLQQSLWDELYYYAMNALTNPSPHTRADGCKILNELIVFNQELIVKELDRLKKLIKDDWWEVKAQALIIFARLFISKKKNNEKSNDLNESLTYKTLINYILQIFKIGVTHNILRIGLIQLAQLLNYEQSLCQRYLDVLLSIGEQIRGDVLNINQLKNGPVVFGSNTFGYRLTGAPLQWNSIGISKALVENIHSKRLGSMSKQHLQILLSCLQDGSQNKNKNIWLQIYKNLKQYIYKALADASLCQLGGEILKKIFLLEQIRSQVLKISKDDFKVFLSNLYKSKQEKTQRNLLNLFEYFNEISEEFREYTYGILKIFSEQEKEKYLNSNLIDFMNVLARKRRAKLFSETS